MRRPPHWSQSCSGRTHRLVGWARRSPIGPPVTRFSPRRSCANWPSAACCAGSRAHTFRRQMSPRSACLPRCRRPSPRVSTVSTRSETTLSAAAVIGSRFSRDLLDRLGIAPVLDDLLAAELIDQVSFTRAAEFAFRHPLIRTVAYESQLKSDRAQMHRRLAAAIEARDPEAADENAALIAEHLEAAGDLHAAYGWHMRAATWATNRDIAAARLSWERAQRSPTHCPPMTPTGRPCASHRAPCCAGPPGESM